MALAHFRMLIYELLNTDTYIVPETSTSIILDSKSDQFTDKNVKYANHNMPIYGRVYFVISGEKCKWYKIYLCEGGMKLADIAAKNIVETYLNTRMKYIMVNIDI